MDRHQGLVLGVEKIEYVHGNGEVHILSFICGPKRRTNIACTPHYGDTSVDKLFARQ
mgnify:CR=1 FL=1